MESGEISNGQVSASSELDGNHAAIQARLYFEAASGKAGSWSAKYNNLDQWLQIDLGSKHEVTGLATQGRNGYGQWVTKYKVQYSDNGVNFQYYMEQRQTTIKVKSFSTRTQTLLTQLTFLHISTIVQCRRVKPNNKPKNQGKVNIFTPVISYFLCTCARHCCWEVSMLHNC